MVFKSSVNWLVELEIGGRTKNIPNYRIKKTGQDTEFWIPEETCCRSDSSKKPLANAGVRNSERVI